MTLPRIHQAGHHVYITIDGHTCTLTGSQAATLSARLDHASRAARRVVAERIRAERIEEQTRRATARGRCVRMRETLLGVLERSEVNDG